jgi:hypothetical protein
VNDDELQRLRVLLTEELKKRIEITRARIASGELTPAHRRMAEEILRRAEALVASDDWIQSRLTVLAVDGSKISSVNSSVLVLEAMVSDTEAIGNSAKFSSSR